MSEDAKFIKPAIMRVRKFRRVAVVFADEADAKNKPKIVFSRNAATLSSNINIPDACIDINGANAAVEDPDEAEDAFYNQMCEECQRNKRRDISPVTFAFILGILLGFFLTTLYWRANLPII